MDKESTKHILNVIRNITHTRKQRDRKMVELEINTKKKPTVKKSSTTVIMVIENMNTSISSSV
jgi:hypothetical protein